VGETPTLLDYCLRNVGGGTPGLAKGVLRQDGGHARDGGGPGDEDLRVVRTL